ncbi:NrsF family protein [Hansschlegelia sp. KR7-227]|uniref:NrsF family protein n=1 Tax=Hansschlegelia sp. KR7-227 TaxID=3400914 RepID=UPI003C068304
MSAAPLAVILLSLRRGAPSSPGAAAGLLAGALGATFYAIHCPAGSPLFVMVWNTLAVAIGTAVGSRVLRW